MCINLSLRSQGFDLVLLLIIILFVKHGNSLLVHNSKDVLLRDAFVLVRLHNELCRLLYKVSLHLRAQHKCVKKAYCLSVSTGRDLAFEVKTPACCI